MSIILAMYIPAFLEVSKECGIDDKLFLYRQHNNNVTGNVAPNKITRVYKAFSGLKNKYVLSCDTINTIKVFYNVYNEYLSHDDRQLLDKYFKTINLRGLKRIVSIIINGYSICNSKIHLLILGRWSYSICRFI